MNYLERFLAVMEYQPADQVTNWELGAWPQTRELWEADGLVSGDFHWNWFTGEEALNLDPREFIHFNNRPLPAYEQETLAEDERTLTFRDALGRVRKGLKEGTVRGGRMSMDTYISFPVTNMQEWQAYKTRLLMRPDRYDVCWPTLRLDGWRARKHPLIFGQNGGMLGWYWFTRELMGTEALSFAFYDQPELIHDIMEFHTDFLIEAARPVLAETTVEYVNFNEDLSMKTGPLISPKFYKAFIYPRLRRVVDFLKSHGVRYVSIDTDGNPEAVIPMMMDAGVDVLWPLERAADQDPVRLRQKFGRSLRLWGGVDKRVLAEGPQAIDEHLRAMRPLIEEGGFIPSVDHTVPPDVSWPNFRHYMASKQKLLRGEL